MATGMATVANSPFALRFSGKVPVHGKAPHSHAQGLASRRRQTAHRPLITTHSYHFPLSNFGAIRSA
jgi:hypothetical protein